MEGQGITKDLLRAYAWAEIAMRSGYDGAAARLDAIMQQLSRRS